MKTKVLTYIKSKQFYFLTLILLLLSNPLLQFYSTSKTEEFKKQRAVHLDSEVKDLTQKGLVAFQEKQKLLQTESGSVAASVTKGKNPTTSTKVFFTVFDTTGNPLSYNRSFIGFTKMQQLLAESKTEAFYSTPRATYLVHIQTLNRNGNQLFIATGLMLEQHYIPASGPENSISFESELEELLLTNVTVLYKETAKITKDGRESGFGIKASGGRNIGVINFQKPTLRQGLTEIDEFFRLTVSIQWLATALVVLILMLPAIRLLKHRIVKFIGVAIVLVALRILLFVLGIPTTYMHNTLSDPQYFSSVFGAGIVRSPIELFITVIFFFGIFLYGFRLSLGFYRSEFSLSKPGLILQSFLLLLIPPAFRGLASALRSFIFDSTLPYFNDSNILPNLVLSVMNLSALLLTASVLLFTVSLVLPVVKDFQRYFPSQKHRRIITLSSVIVIPLFYYGVIGEKLIPLPYLVVLFAGLWLSIFLVIRYQFQKRYLVLQVLAISSVLSIILLIVFNGEIEKESLKKTALELNRPDENLLNFLVIQTLDEASSDPSLLTEIQSKTPDHNAFCFAAWSNSPLRSEKLKAYVGVFSSSLIPLGSFSTSVETSAGKDSLLSELIKQDVTLLEMANSNGEGTVTVGYTPLQKGDSVVAYILATVEYDEAALFLQPAPAYFASGRMKLNSVVDERKISIVSITPNSKKGFGTFYPNNEQLTQIMELPEQGKSDKWLTLTQAGVPFQLFVYFNKSANSSTPQLITAVALPEKELSRVFFNFFKLFIIHSIFILLYYIILFLNDLKRQVKKLFSFKSQLLFSFLLLSIIPLLALAMYNRTNVESQSRENSIELLNERAKAIKQSINLLGEGDTVITTLFSESARLTSTAFIGYKNTKAVYSSYNGITGESLFPQLLPDEVIKALLEAGNNSFVTTDTVDGLTGTTLYSSLNVNGETFVIAVPTLLNITNTRLSTVDFDVFLFGVYSFAILLITLSGNFLANKISNPIRRLTNATKSVGHGDLSIELQETGRGEINELIAGFNTMTAELRKSQEDIASLERENAWKEMARQVAHEIKNPLTPMKLSVQHLMSAAKDKRENFDELMNKVLTTVLLQIETLSRIATEFSSFARMPSPSLETINLLSLLDEIVTLYNTPATAVTLTAPQEQMNVLADTSHLKRVFINLIRNSIQAGAVAIAINVNRSEKLYNITITDNGSGIAEENQALIFDKSFTTKQSGMGIGLKISKRFLETIGGSIILEESFSGKTVFVIQLPIQL